MKFKVSEDDYKIITKKLSREPNSLEEALFSAMWSEHCGYRHSKKLLETLYKKGSMLSGENAGGIKIGKTAVVFKMESHNHPSAVEPYNGAATGVGGIVRDILAMGARPLVLGDSLKFGDLKEKNVKHIAEGVVRGISDYANSIGVPTIFGEADFYDFYNRNPLVNVFALGAVPFRKIVTSKAEDNKLIVLLGNPTRGDGLGGAAFASKELESSGQEDRISVQIADPFVKKKLIEASMEIFQKGIAIASQDCGAAGILSSTSEIAFKTGCGVELQLEKVHLGDYSLGCAEIMLSETQERMVFVVEKSSLAKIKKIAKKYELEYSVIGKTLPGKSYTLKYQGKVVADLPVKLLCEPPAKKTSSRKQREKRRLVKKVRMNKSDDGLEDKIMEFLSSPNVASKEYIYSQYDHTVGARTVIVPAFQGASAIWLKEEEVFLGLAMSSNPLMTLCSAYDGTKNVIIDAYRKLCAAGFEPLGMTNCLNFANPEIPEVFSDFKQTIKAMNEACEALKLPVVSGNVSFYNESEDVGVPPTPVFALVGKLNSAKMPLRAYFKSDETVFLLGDDITKNTNSAASLYFKTLYNAHGGTLPEVDFKKEKKLKKLIKHLHSKELINAATSVGKGGLFMSLFKSLVPTNSGFIGKISQNSLTNHEHAFFAESNARYLVSTSQKGEFYKFMTTEKIPFRELGTVNSASIIKLDNVVLEKKKCFSQFKNSLESAI